MPAAVSFSLSPLPGVSALPEIWIGLDTGGTYTDAVALGERRVVASAKALTTHWDLSIGLAEAIRAVLGKLPAGARREHISLVSVSTTLATNAVVEKRFSQICTLLIGFDEQMVERSGLKRAEGVSSCACVAATRRPGRRGSRSMSRRSTRRCASSAAGRGICRRGDVFGTQSGARAAGARAYPRDVCQTGHMQPRAELATRCTQARTDRRPQRASDATDRASARCAGRVLEREGISAPVMVVKGDGTLIRPRLRSSTRSRRCCPGRRRALWAPASSAALRNLRSRTWVARRPMSPSSSAAGRSCAPKAR